MHIQYSYNSNVSILLVSLLSRASGSLRTTPFHFSKKCFYTCVFKGGWAMPEYKATMSGPVYLYLIHVTKCPHCT